MTYRLAFRVVFKVKAGLLNVVITGDLLIGFCRPLRLGRLEFLRDVLLLWLHRLLLHNFLVVPADFFVAGIPLVEILVPEVADAFVCLAFGKSFVGVLRNILRLCTSIILWLISVVLWLVAIINLLVAIKVINLLVAIMAINLLVAIVVVKLLVSVVNLLVAIVWLCIS